MLHGGAARVQADQRLFGMQIIIDGSAATEFGGACEGCSSRVELIWREGVPGKRCRAFTHAFVRTDWPLSRFG